MPSAEEASDTQFAEGAVVAVQLWATEGSVKREKQTKAASIQKMPPYAMEARTPRPERRQDLKQVRRIRKVAPDASAAGPMRPGEALPLASSDGTSFVRALFLWHFNDWDGGRPGLFRFVAGRRYFLRVDFLA